MNEKTVNKIMEEIAELYENKPWLRINDFYVYGDDYKSVCVHFSAFGQTGAQYVQEIANIYGVSWVIFAHKSIDGDVCVNFYQ